jgi:hypothetical protein
MNLLLREMSSKNLWRLSSIILKIKAKNYTMLFWLIMIISYQLKIYVRIWALLWSNPFKDCLSRSVILLQAYQNSVRRLKTISIQGFYLQNSSNTSIKLKLTSFSNHFAMIFKWELKRLSSLKLLLYAKIWLSSISCQ